jgi:hypothetical protein
MIKTNKEKLVKMSVLGEVSHPSTLGVGYRTTFDGKPSFVPGTRGVKLNFRVGDPAYGWAADHIEPGINIGNKGSVREFTAFNAFACIGNDVKIVSGDAKGSKGKITGKHGWTSTFADFPLEVMEKVSPEDKMQVTGWGVGLEIKGFEDIRIMSLSPDLLEKMGVDEDNSQLQVPVVTEVPGKMMGSGMGGGSGGMPDLGDFDIQSTSPELTKKFNLSKLRIGDIVAIKDMYSHYARGIYPGAVTVGVVSHGASFMSGHGPGVPPVMSSVPGRIKPVIDAKANVAYYLNLRPDIDW